MFFSVNSIEVAKGSRELARFVLDKLSKSLPPRFNIFLRLYKGPLARSLGHTGILKIGHGHWVESEIAYPPFAVASHRTPTPIRRSDASPILLSTATTSVTT